ncbi:MAG: hypothetical protein A3I87_02680 [Candidatus Staskawiczbacteria bacterium RIFCSPLOWO2_02_FULL_39_8]|nr:MAG: hypothetical protein A3I87_02680 [Candidatus Staskawiczbacteria bacterium RIFCSPLOWO2_02_FULL_39_8]
MTKIREMTWGLILLYVFPFVLGVVALIVVAIHHENEKLGDPTPVIALGVGLIGAGIGGFIQYLLEKTEGQYSPDNSQDQKHEELTATH